MSHFFKQRIQKTIPFISPLSPPREWQLHKGRKFDLFRSLLCPSPRPGSGSIKSGETNHLVPWKREIVPGRWWPQFTE